MTDNTVKAKTTLSFQLNFMLLMLNAGRNEEAVEACNKLDAVIQALPDDLFVEVDQ
jgi:hypothetical protein